MNKEVLFLADHHPVVPYIVRSHQFASRASSFAAASDSSVRVELAFPGPLVERTFLENQIGMSLTEVKLHFGPERTKRILGAKLSLTFRFRSWLKKKIVVARAEGEITVYFRTLSLAYHLLPFLKKNQIKYIFETHEIFHLTGHKNREEIKRKEAAVYEGAAEVVVISEPLRDDLEEIFKIKASCVLSSGHNSALSDVRPYSVEAEPRFLYIGSLHRWKGVEKFLIETSSLRVPTDIVGDGGALERMKDFVREHELDHVVLHGQCAPEQLSKFYTAGSICVLPLSEDCIARKYTSPLKIFEYSSAGRPVLVGKYPSISTINGIHDSAMLVEGDWLDASRKLLGDCELRKKLAANALVFAGNYSWTSVAERFFKVERRT